MLRRLIVIAIALFTLTGCNLRDRYDAAIEREPVQFAVDYVALLQAHNFAAAEAKINPQLKTKHLRAMLEQIAAMLPPVTVVAPKVVEWASSRKAGKYQFTLEYKRPDQPWVAFEVVLSRVGSSYRVDDAASKTLSQSIDPFGFENKPLTNYIFLIGAVIVPLFIIVSIITCLRTPMRRKWRWILFMMVGIGSVNLEWAQSNVSIVTDTSTATKTEWSVTFFNLLGAAVRQNWVFDPITISISLPLGAIVFWIVWLRRRPATATWTNTDPRAPTGRETGTGYGDRVAGYTAPRSRPLGDPRAIQREHAVLRPLSVPIHRTGQKVLRGDHTQKWQATYRLLAVAAVLLAVLVGTLISKAG